MINTLFEENDPEHLGLLKEVLQVIFGLEPKTATRVIRIIQHSVDASDVKTNKIRMRIGARALKYLRNSIEIARHDGIEKHEKEKEEDVEKDYDLEPEQQRMEQDRKKQTEKKSTNEAMSFKTFYISEEEVTITVDPDNEQEVRQKVANARRNPMLATKQGIQDAREEKADAQRSGDPLKAKIAALRAQLRQLEARQQDQNKKGTM